MQVKKERLIKWFDFVRYQNHQSKLFSDCFFASQLDSKEWVVNTAMNLPTSATENIYIVGGWYGVLAQLLHDNLFMNDRIYTIDKDPYCESIVNFFDDPQIVPITDLAERFEYFEPPSLVINTITEHLTQDLYDAWWENVPEGTHFILQGNDFDQVDEHVRCPQTMSEFQSQSRVEDAMLIDSEVIECDGYFKRWMLAGVK